MALFGKKTQHNFPIDAVFTWVDGEDLDWIEQKERREVSVHKGSESITLAKQGISQYRDNEELKYALRSFTKFAPWVRKIHIVTANQKPAWLNKEKVNLVPHEAIFPCPERFLPVFNAHPIELCVHRIPDLSEQFIYVNDDFMLGRPVFPSDFFLPDGSPLVWATKEKDNYLENQSFKENKTILEKVALHTYQVAKGMFGIDLPYGIQNYPKAMTRDSTRQVWELFQEPVLTTLMSPFCSPRDISITILSPLFLLITGLGKLRAINGYKQSLDRFHGGIAYIGASLGDKNLSDELNRIEKMRPKAFCLNDTDDATPFDRLLMRTFLEKMFPDPSPFEL